MHLLKPCVVHYFTITAHVVMDYPLLITECDQYWKSFKSNAYIHTFIHIHLGHIDLGSKQMLLLWLKLTDCNHVTCSHVNNVISMHPSAGWRLVEWRLRPFVYCLTHIQINKTYCFSKAWSCLYTNICRTFYHRWEDNTCLLSSCLFVCREHYIYI